MTIPLSELPMGSAEHLSFNSDAIPPAERFERYRALYAGGADAVAIGPDFRAVMQGWRLDRALVYDRKLHDVAHRRDRERVERDGFGHFTLTTVLSGRFEVDVGQGPQRVLPRQATLIDMLSPMSNRSAHAHIITISIARDRMIAAAGSTDGLHGLVLDGDRAALLVDFMSSLVSRIENLPAASGVSAAHALTALLAVALEGRSAGGFDDRIPPGDAARVARIRRLIDQSLSDPAFGPDTVVAQSTLSRATLYRAFKAQGGLSSYIQRRRVDRVRVMLSDPRDNRSFAQIAYSAGFTSEAHCSRLFVEQFGMRPGEYRATMLPSRDDPDPGRRMRYWQDEIS